MLIREIRAYLAAAGPETVEQIKQRMGDLGREGLSHSAMAAKLNVPIEVLRVLAASKALQAHKAREKARYRLAREASAEERNQKRAEKWKAREALIAEEAAEATRRRAETALRSKVARRLRNTSKAADVRGYEFHLRPEDIEARIAEGRCEKTGLVLEPRGDFAGSLDRINNSLGYTKDNVQLTCWIYNRAKGASPDEAVLRMAVALVGKTLEDQQISFEQLKLQTLGYKWD